MWNALLKRYVSSVDKPVCGVYLVWDAVIDVFLGPGPWRTLVDGALVLREVVVEDGKVWPHRRQSTTRQLVDYERQLCRSIDGAESGPVRSRDWTEGQLLLL